MKKLLSQAARRVLGRARKPFLALLACWLGLMAWSNLSPGGPAPGPKTDPASIRVVTWNILRGEEDGPPWKQFSWPARRHALRAALRDAQPDVLCVQEALPGQVAFLEEALPTHARIGVGRDDGRAAGEHCAICVRRDRFEVLDEGTFWLDEPRDEPGAARGLRVKRICTWVRLRDRTSGRALRVYNTHSYLTEKARLRAARVVLDHIAAGDRTDGLIVAGDFNAPPGAPSRRLFADAGLADSAELDRRPAGTPTYQWYGIRLRCLDGILVGPGWQVRRHHILDVKPDNIYPSDHFGVLADLALGE